MCAILGYSGTIKPYILRGLFRIGSKWGPHSVGLAYDEDGIIKYWKKAESPEYFLRNRNHRLDYAATKTLGFGHVRYATHGEVIDKNAHPFYYGNSVFAHNGVIGNYQQISPNAVVDSECCGPLIVKRDLSLAQGSVGLIWLEYIPGEVQRGGKTYLEYTPKMFIYRQRQNLSAATFNSPWGQFTLVASRVEMFVPVLSDPKITMVAQHPLEMGVAYEVLDTGIKMAWKNPEPVWSGQSYRSGQPYRPVLTTTMPSCGV